MLRFELYSPVSERGGHAYEIVGGVLASIVGHKHFE